MISVLDYGAGNANSVIRMIERAGGQANRISTSDELLSARKLIIPGVGAFDYGMTKLDSQGLIPTLNKIALESHIPILGICLGMQLMCRSSEEGNLSGLGWIDADVKRFQGASLNGLRVPHMGWNTIDTIRHNPLIPLEESEKRYYFVHSYWVDCHNHADAIALTYYGKKFVAAFQRKNLFGVQFHPEKSHRFGTALLQRFVELPFA